MTAPLFPVLTRVVCCPCCRVQVDAIGGTRFDDGGGGDNEVQRTMLEIVNQLDGFDSRGNIKVRGRAADCRESLMSLSLLLLVEVVVVVVGFSPYSYSIPWVSFFWKKSPCRNGGWTSLYHASTLCLLRRSQVFAVRSLPMAAPHRC